MKRLFFAVALATALATTGVAVAGFSSGTYRGKSAQGLNIKLKVTNHGHCGSFKAPCLAAASYRANYNCATDDNTTQKATAQLTKLGATKIVHGKIKATYAAGDTDHIVLKATFRGHKATGSFRERYVVEHDNGTSTVCFSGTVTFTAQR
jgi:hypothetical protein